MCRMGSTASVRGQPLSSGQAGCARGTHLDVGAGVDLVHCVPGGAPRLSVQVVALHKHGVVAKAAHPDVPFAFTLQLHSLTDVEPGRKQGNIGVCMGQWFVTCVPPQYP